MLSRYFCDPYGNLKTLLLGAVSIGCAILAGCADSGNRSVDVRFAIADIPDDAQISLLNVQFYISNVELITEDGRAFPFRPDAVAPWQSEHVALIDLTEPSGNAGNSAITGSVAASAEERFVGIRFDVGVPFAQNHADPLAAAAPLDRMDMFWAWQTGYKFLRVELADDGTAWAFHLGSTGCTSASAIRPPAGECAQPNRVMAELTGFDPASDTVLLQLPALISAMRAADHASCIGNYAHDPACRAPFALTGLPSDAGSQRLFAAPD